MKNPIVDDFIEVGDSDVIEDKAVLEFFFEKPETVRTLLVLRLLFILYQIAAGTRICAQRRWWSHNINVSQCQLPMHQLGVNTNTQLCFSVGQLTLAKPSEEVMFQR